jgi:hypothetical protein
MHDMSTPRRSGTTIYVIRAQGRLCPTWSRMLGGLRIVTTSSADDHPIVTVTGPLLDQAELLDVLDGLYSLGLPLRSVHRLTLADEQAEAERRAPTSAFTAHQTPGQFAPQPVWRPRLTEAR